MGETIEALLMDSSNPSGDAKGDTEYDDRLMDTFQERGSIYVDEKCDAGSYLFRRAVCVTFVLPCDYITLI